MARASQKKSERISNLKQKGISPASQGLTPEGDPLPESTAIDLNVEHTDEDAEEEEETEEAGKEPAKGDPVPSNSESDNLAENPSKKMKRKGAKKTVAAESEDSLGSDADSDPEVTPSWRDQARRRNDAAVLKCVKAARANHASVLSVEIPVACEPLRSLFVRLGIDDIAARCMIKVEGLVNKICLVALDDDRITSM